MDETFRSRCASESSAQSESIGEFYEGACDSHVVSNAVSDEILLLAEGSPIEEDDSESAALRRCRETLEALGRSDVAAESSAYGAELCHSRKQAAAGSCPNFTSPEKDENSALQNDIPSRSRKRLLEVLDFSK